MLRRTFTQILASLPFIKPNLGIIPSKNDILANCIVEKIVIIASENETEIHDPDSTINYAIDIIIKSMKESLVFFNISTENELTKELVIKLFRQGIPNLDYYTSFGIVYSIEYDQYYLAMGNDINPGLNELWAHYKHTYWDKKILKESNYSNMIQYNANE